MAKVMKMADKTIRSKVTESVPGLTKGKAYVFVKWGFYQGAYFTIINDRGEKISIYDPKKYLHTEDIESTK
jgi:hypothetical protein